MKINNVISSGIKKKFVALTYDEEQELAVSVMESLSKPWVNGKFRELASRIYSESTSGFGCEADTIMEYFDILGKWTNYLDDADKVEEAPFSPHFEMNGESVRAPDKNRFGVTSKQWKSQWYIEERRRAWREAWVLLRKNLCDYSDDYRVFPGDPEDDVEAQDLVDLELFFEGVKETKKTYKCSHNQAMRETMDRMPHAHLSLEELYDISSEFI